MAFNSKDSIRPIMQKRIIVSDAKARKKYKLDNPLCELCLACGKEFPADDLDHVTGHFTEGTRTDELWNFAHLCRRHHQLATWHASDIDDFFHWRCLIFAIKLLAGVGKDQLFSVIISADGAGEKLPSGNQWMICIMQSMDLMQKLKGIK